VAFERADRILIGLVDGREEDPGAHRVPPIDRSVT